MTQGRANDSIVKGWYCPLPRYRRRPQGHTYRLIDGDRHKWCPVCKDYWPADTEFWYPGPGNATGLHDRCKACYEEWRAERGGRAA